MKRKIVRIGRIAIIAVALKVVVLVGLFVLFAVYTNVSTDVEPQDRVVFEQVLHLKPLRYPKTFADEIMVIRVIQQRTFEHAQVGAGIPDFQPREPIDFLNKGEGLCFDRSRTTDKALEYIGLPSRHVYLLFRQGDQGFWKSLLAYRHPSHAVTEVKTSKGWMYIDSNSQWIGLTRDSLVVSADDILKRSAEFNSIPEYLNHPWWAIRGMYSRKGQLYPPYVLFPDLNWIDFFSWLLVG